MVGRPGLGVTTKVVYQRDALDRVIERDTYNGTTLTGQVLYYYQDDSSDPAEIYDNLHATTTTMVVDATGGATFATTGTASSWSYPNLHGDDVTTANGTGTKTEVTTN